MDDDPSGKSVLKYFENSDNNKHSQWSRSAANAKLGKHTEHLLRRENSSQSSDISKHRSSLSSLGLSSFSFVDISDDRQPLHGNVLKQGRAKSSRMTEASRRPLQRAKSAHPVIRIDDWSSVTPGCPATTEKHRQTSKKDSRRLDIHDSGMLQPNQRSRSNSSVSADSTASYSTGYNFHKDALNQLETRLKLVGDFNAPLTNQATKPVNSSQIFQKVMADMYKSMQHGKPQNITNLTQETNLYAARFLGRARALRALRGIEEISIEADLNTARQSKSSVTENAERGWRILRSHVRVLTAERRKRRSKQSWDLLRYTVKGMTNMERTRLDLYQRYGIVPVVRSDGSVVKENSMLSDRARLALAIQNNDSAGQQREGGVKDTRNSRVSCHAHHRMCRQSSHSSVLIHQPRKFLTTPTKNFMKLGDKAFEKKNGV
ncbi:unnamed protein product [Lymnaea stagnalis]|uniref:Uncharacterized protein n=1 Tax=Lymnaea stagnalis TaxID=6523 RepID=A0AAV2H0M3_LYMST